ncbi:MAG TPA: IS200/IS605 family element transposase accessory protein TnpB [Thermosynechococcus sp. M46_R2017_013]|nr:IS200/IS605 family element transposase accessory protein TnpB [Thermosynechococcus sp. M46_R2017_013]
MKKFSTKGISQVRSQARLKVARLHPRIADARRDFRHKLSTRLVNENQAIAIEILSVSNMQKNRCLAKSISDTGWSECLRQLKYKAHGYGRTLLAATNGIQRPSDVRIVGIQCPRCH